MGYGFWVTEEPVTYHPRIVVFENAFERLIAGQNVDLYGAGLSSEFEGVAWWLFAKHRPDVWYDGVDLLQARRRKARQVEFGGAMWVARDRDQWLEPFRARVTDQERTRQGLVVAMRIGSFSAEGDLLEYFRC